MDLSALLIHLPFIGLLVVQSFSLPQRSLKRNLTIDAAVAVVMYVVLFLVWLLS